MSQAPGERGFFAFESHVPVTGLDRIGLCAWPGSFPLRARCRDTFYGLPCLIEPKTRDCLDFRIACRLRQMTPHRFEDIPDVPDHKEQSMTDTPPESYPAGYAPDRVWRPTAALGGQFGSINRPVSAPGSSVNCRWAGIRCSSIRRVRPTGRRSPSCSRNCWRPGIREPSTTPG